MNDSILARDMVTEYTTSYAMYVAQNRAIPSLLDGLKPVWRRCINAANDLKLYHNKKHLKVSKLAGDVLGSYHPHGGANPVPLAQPFRFRYPMFDGQGNYGSPDLPDSYAAARYLEIRLSKFAEDFYLSSADYADTCKNYDGRLDEITQYYPVLPGCLFTGASGIAVGFSTEVPVHTIGDIGNSILTYIANRDSEDYLEGLYPETCEESVVMTPLEEIKELYLTGRGSVRYKAKTHYEMVGDKTALVVDAFPPGFSKKRLETQRILDAVDNGTLELFNESAEKVRYLFVSSDKSLLSSVEERISTSVGYRMYIEHKGIIKVYKLSEIYDTFIEEKSAYLIRKYTSLKEDVCKDIDYFRVLLALKSDRSYIKTMFDKDSSVVIEEITVRYDTDTDTAKRVLTTSLKSLMKDNHQAIQQKIEDLSALKSEYQSYIDDPLSKIKSDIVKLMEEYHDEKRATLLEAKTDTFELVYRGKKIEIVSDLLYFVGSKDNIISTRYGSDLRNMPIDDYHIAAANKKFYFLYDGRGCCTVEREVLLTTGSKLNAKTLYGIIGIDSLNDITVEQGNRKVYRGVNWSLRKKLSYIKLSKEDEPEFKILEAPNS